MNNIIGKRINSALAEKDIKQKELAKKIGVNDNVISYWCSGSRTPNTQQIIQICNVLGVSADYLLGLTDVAKTSKYASLLLKSGQVKGECNNGKN